MVKLSVVPKKNFNKVRFVRKKFYEVVFDLHYSKLSGFFSKSPKKTRRFVSWRLFKKGYEIMPRSAIGNGFVNVFKYYTYPCLVAQEYGKITDYHLETLRRILKKGSSKRSFIVKRVYPYMRLLKRTNQVRMGGGKGSKFDKFVYPVYPGSVLVDIRGIHKGSVRRIMDYAKTKLSFKVKLVFLDRY